jgi:hypothetical protein
VQGLTEVSDDTQITNGEGETAPALAASDAPPEQAMPATATAAIALPGAGLTATLPAPAGLPATGRAPAGLSAAGLAPLGLAAIGLTPAGLPAADLPAAGPAAAGLPPAGPAAAGLAPADLPATGLAAVGLPVADLTPASLTPAADLPAGLPVAALPTAAAAAVGPAAPIVVVRPPRPCRIDFEGCAGTEAVRVEVRAWLDRLGDLTAPMTGAEVVIASIVEPRKERLYRVRMRLTMRAGVVAVAPDHPNNGPHEDIFCAIRNAFRAARRQLESYQKEHPAPVEADPPAPPAPPLTGT